MRRGYGDGYAGFPDLKAPNTMDDGHIPHRKFTKRFIGQRIHLLDRHLGISVVIKKQGPASAAVIANNPFEQRDRAVFRLPNLFDQS